MPIIEAVQASDYLGIVPAEVRRAHNGAAVTLLDGLHQFEADYKTLCITRHLGYWQHPEDGQINPVVRHFRNDLIDLYAEELPDISKHNSNPLHIYNAHVEHDSGISFYELECIDRTLGIQRGIRRQ